MASFPAKTGRDRPRKREKKNLSFWSIQFQPAIGISKKLAKKVKKLKYIIMAYFRAKTRRERMQMWGKKNSRSDPFQPDLEWGILER